MPGHGRHVRILYTPKFSVEGQNPPAGCFPEYIISSRLLDFLTLSGTTCAAKHSAQYGFGDMCANNDGKHIIFSPICKIRIFLTQPLVRKHYGDCHFTRNGGFVEVMLPAAGYKMQKNVMKTK